MPVTKWRVRKDGIEHACDGRTIEPDTLARLVQAHPRHVTTFGKPIRPAVSRPEDVLDLCQDLLWEGGSWDDTIDWVYEPDPPSQDGIVY